MQMRCDGVELRDENMRQRKRKSDRWLGRGKPFEPDPESVGQTRVWAERSVIRQLKVSPEHRLGVQPRILDDAMHMQEQLRIPSREIPQETFRHGSKMALHVIW